MTFPWEELTYADIRDKIEKVVITSLSSTWNTLISGAQSGEVVYVTKVEAESGTPTSAPVVLLREQGSNSITIDRIQLQASATIINQVRVKVGSDDIKTPWYALDGIGELQARADQSGITNVIATFWREK